MNLIVIAPKMANLALKITVISALHTLKKLGHFTFMAKGINQNLGNY
jgi:hypothetical protein